MKAWAVLLLPGVLLAGSDPWEAFLRRHGEAGRVHGLWLLVREGYRGEAALYKEGPLFEAMAGKDLEAWQAPPQALAALAEREGRSGVEWALVDPGGRVRLAGAGEPTARALREAMEGSGWQPRWARRAAFLAAHPGHGDALQEAADEATTRLNRFDWLNPSQPLEGELGRRLVLEPCLEVFRGFLALPMEDRESAKAWRWMWVLLLHRAGKVPAFEEPLRRTLQLLEDRMVQDPGDDDFWDLWLALADLVPGSNAEALLARLEPAPGCPWPTSRVAQAVALDIRDPRKRLERIEAELAMPDPFLHRLRAWGPIKSRTLETLGRPEEARQWGEEMRRRDSRRLAPQAVLHIFGPAEWRKELERHPHLDAWARGWWPFEPGELAFHQDGGKEEAKLRARLELAPGVRWVLLWDEARILAQGERPPDPQALADLLREGPPPRLERLEAFLRSHPGHRQAQAALVWLLRERMPHPRLELRLAQACAELGEASILQVPGPTFQPQRPLWRAAARKALPGAEARLVRWPESLDAWMAWMDWQSLMDRPASPTAHLHTLAVWKSRQRGGPGPLPLNVAAGVAQRLEAEGRWKDLAEWGLHQWEGGWKQVLGALGASTEEARDQSRRKDFATLVSTTLAALRRAGRRGEAEAFREDLQRGDKSLLAEMGRVKK